MEESKMKLYDSVALVTGGAGGIGSAISEALTREGCKIAIHYFSNRGKAELLQAKLLSEGKICSIFQADLRQDEEAVRLINDVIATFGQIDILINNAGWSRLVLPDNLSGLTDEVIGQTISLKINAPIYLIRAAAPHLKVSGKGSIINITSASGHAARGSSLIYAAVNAALYNLTKSFARILSPSVRVNAIAPGYVETGFVFPTDGNMARRVSSQNHTGRIVTAAEIASLVVFLCSEGISITGEEIIVDGGIARLGKR